mgnify:FL=1
MTTENTKPYEGKTCFVITPIGGDNTDIRREADGIIDEVLEPVLGDFFGFNLEVAHRTYSTGSITDKVIQSVVESELAICNLATLNPNVMYELALRHAARKPVVTIAPKGTALPFDINDDRVIFYENDIAGSYQLKKDLPLMIEAAMEEDIPNNPVYRAIKSGKIMQEVRAEGGVDAAILEAIDGLSSKINSIQSKAPKLNSLRDNSIVNISRLPASYNSLKDKNILVRKRGLKELDDNDMATIKDLIVSADIVHDFSNVLNISMSDNLHISIAISARANLIYGGVATKLMQDQIISVLANSNYECEIV